jgi:hypothetical protein
MSPPPSILVAAAIRPSGCPVVKLNGAAHAGETEKTNAAAKNNRVN